MAERLLLELKGKFGADLGTPSAGATSDAQADILQALVALGYSDKEAAASLKALPRDVGVTFFSRALQTASPQVLPISAEEKGWFPLLLALIAKDSPSRTRS